MSTAPTEPGSAPQSRFAERMARATHGTVEDSVKIRVIVLSCVLVGVGAVVAQGAIDAATAAAAFILIPAGFAFSHVRRHDRNIPVKIILAAGMVVALGVFLSSVQRATSVDEARTMLAGLFVWVQVLHSFDLPRRRDLAYSMISSLVLMAAAASLTLNTSYGLFVLAYLPLAGTWLVMSSGLRDQERAAPTRVRRVSGARKPRSVRMLVVTGTIAVAASLLVFAVVPRVEGFQVIAPPFSLGGGSTVPGFNGAVVNPGLPQGTPAGGVTPYVPNAYPGFGDSVDLRARGHLSDDVVMKVRSPQPAFWRAQAYDTWDGTTWTASDITTTQVGGEAPIAIPKPVEAQNAWSSERLTQTFFIQKQQPNIVFAATQPEQVYFPASTLAVDTYGSIRSPILLDQGLVYSVTSAVTTATPAQLRDSPARWSPEVFGRYLQIPSELPQRVIDLSHQITDGQPTTYDKVMAVQNWLKRNTQYNLDIPPDPPGVDAVDHFLFVTHQGFCEHISAAMVMLLRASGIPARFAVGFGPGERNPFTGYFEVRESDAHSWVEVYYPGIGWQEYDPTHVVPDPNAGFTNTFAGTQIFSSIGKFLGAVIPDGVKDAVGGVVGGVAKGAQAAARSWPVVLALAALAAVAFALTTRRRRTKRRGPPPVGAEAAFVTLCDTFAERGHPRAPQSTPAEYLGELLASDGMAQAHESEVRRIIDVFERDRFAGASPDQTDVAASLEAADKIRVGSRAT